MSIRECVITVFHLQKQYTCYAVSLERGLTDMTPGPKSSPASHDSHPGTGAYVSCGISRNATHTRCASPPAAERGTSSWACGGPAWRGLTCLVASAPATGRRRRRAACARSCVGFRTLLPRLLSTPPHGSFLERQPHTWVGPLRSERSQGGGIGKLQAPPVATPPLSTHGLAWGGMGRVVLEPACPALPGAGPAAGTKL